MPKCFTNCMSDYGTWLNFKLLGTLSMHKSKLVSVPPVLLLYCCRVNDDSVMVSPGWTEAFIDKLANLNPPNVGVVGPNHVGGSTAILTYDFTHHTHQDIFGFHYPRCFQGKNQYAKCYEYIYFYFNMHNFHKLITNCILCKALKIVHFSNFLNCTCNRVKAWIMTSTRLCS